MANFTFVACSVAVFAIHTAGEAPHPVLGIPRNVSLPTCSVHGYVAEATVIGQGLGSSCPSERANDRPSTVATYMRPVWTSSTSCDRGYTPDETDSHGYDAVIGAITRRRPGEYARGVLMPREGSLPIAVLPTACSPLAHGSFARPVVGSLGFYPATSWMVEPTRSKDLYRPHGSWPRGIIRTTARPENNTLRQPPCLICDTQCHLHEESPSAGLTFLSQPFEHRVRAGSTSVSYRDYRWRR